MGEAVTAGVAYRGFGFDYGLPSAPEAEEAGVHVEGRRHEATGRADLALAGRGFTFLRVDGSAQRYAHDEVESSGEVGTTFELSTQTTSLTGRTAIGRLTGAVGVSGLFRQYSPTGEEALTPAADSRSGGVFFFQELPLAGRGVDPERAARLQVGARYERFRIHSRDGEERFDAARTRDFQNLSGSVGVSVPLGPDLSLGVSAARAFRAPIVEELFSNGFHAAVGTYDIGDPRLVAETNQGLEAVLRAIPMIVRSSARTMLRGGPIECWGGRLRPPRQRTDAYGFARYTEDTRRRVVGPSLLSASTPWHRCRRTSPYQRRGPATGACGASAAEPSSRRNIPPRTTSSPLWCTRKCSHG